MKDLFSVKDKVVFITGGDQNIGMAVAKGFAESGAKVVIGNTSREKAEGIIRFMEEGGYDYLWVKTDISKEEEIKAAFDAIMEKYGRIDVLFNNAAVRVNQMGLEHEADSWDWIFDINVRGTMLCSREAARLMKAQGGGKIINTSSISSVRGMVNRTSYCATKAAVNGYTAACAVEWSKYGIYVNAVAWGGVNVEETAYADMPAGMQEVVRMTPTEHLANAEELYGAVAFLATDASNGMSGQVVFVDGGWSIAGKPQEIS